MRPIPTASDVPLALRPAEPGDLEAIAAIYNHYVLHSTCTFAEQPEGPTYWANWLASHVAQHPSIVAVRGGHVVGWGTLSRWNSRCAYRFSVEDSVYVRADCHRQGIGDAVLRELLDRARALGHRTVIAQIADHQPASVRLHERHGFRSVGTLQNVGFKFNRWIDVSIFQRPLGPED